MLGHNEADTAHVPHLARGQQPIALQVPTLIGLAHDLPSELARDAGVEDEKLDTLGRIMRHGEICRPDGVVGDASQDAVATERGLRLVLLVSSRCRCVVAVQRVMHEVLCRGQTLDAAGEMGISRLVNNEVRLLAPIERVLDFGLDSGENSLGSIAFGLGRVLFVAERAQLDERRDLLLRLREQGAPSGRVRNLPGNEDRVDLVLDLREDGLALFCRKNHSPIRGVKTLIRS